MSGDIISTWPIKPADPKRQSTNYDGKVCRVGRDFIHVRPVPLKYNAVFRLNGIVLKALFGPIEPAPKAQTKTTSGLVECRRITPDDMMSGFEQAILGDAK